MNQTAMPNTIPAPVPMRSRLVMVLLAFTVGCVAGIGAVIFRFMIGFIHNVTITGRFALVYDANSHSAHSPWGWGLIFVPVIGAIFVAWLVKNFAPEAKGHGVPEVMDAIYYKEGKISGWVAIVKSLASSISIGTGGSVGREGPIVQIGSAFGSMLGSVLSMPARQRVTLIAAGAAGGIAATFNTPIGALAFAVELMLVSISADTMLVVGVSTVVATYIGRACIGLAPAFDVPSLQVPAFHVINPIFLASFVPAGILFGFISVGYVHIIYWFEDFFDKMPGNYYTRHMLGMLCVGMMMTIFLHTTGHYYVEGVGYATVIDVLRGVLWHPEFLLLLCVMKLLATGLTLGSGASGGIFSPALFVGATLGAAAGWIVKLVFPDFPVDPIVFAITGMAGMISGSTGAVLTAITMVTEMTQDTSVMLPVFLVSFLSYAVRKYYSHDSIYTLKISRRGNFLPQGLLAGLTPVQRADHILATTFYVVTTKALQDGALLPAEGVTTIVTQDNRILGLLRAEHYDVDFKNATVEDYIDKRFSVVDKRIFIPELMRTMHHEAVDTAIVIDKLFGEGAAAIVGLISAPQLVDAYRKTMQLVD